MVEPAFARKMFVVPALIRLGLYSDQAERLLMGTAAVESNFTNFEQGYRDKISGWHRKGPARGMFQMEPATFNDMIGRVLSIKNNQALRDAVLATSVECPPLFLEITANHLFAAAMARVKYHSVHAHIPNSLGDQAQFWWTYYNGRSANGLKPKDYLNTWDEYCAHLYT